MKISSRYARWRNDGMLFAVFGEHFKLEEDPKRPLEVVGVVKNSRREDLCSPKGPFFYMALTQKGMFPVRLQVRTAGSPESMAQGIIGLIRSREPNMPLADVQTVTDALNTPNGLWPSSWAPYWPLPWES